MRSLERVGVRQRYGDHHEAGGGRRTPDALMLLKGEGMATSDRTTGTRDEHYNVISVLYHALQGADTCATYLQDAEHAGDQELAQFFREVQGTYRQLADRGKTLLRQRLR
jgi:hypothetical protein